ncbi:acyl-CoA dehydrogenase family protein [Nocardia sp. NPDC005746]|uniref:acyl-CoA dehydrogenase family protein n=1 Tax=Nocardia sp. NPDC005746 TaxID=3157062 RepID=UPI0033C241A1
MDFDLTPEQEMLRDTVRDLLARGRDTERWATFADIGLLGLTFDEADGGMGAGPIEAMLVMTEIGRALATEPILDCALLPGALISAAGSDVQRKDLLPRVAEGQLKLAFAHGEPGLRWPATDTGTRAVPDGDRWRITGRKHPVSHGDQADVLIVSAAHEDGVGLFLVKPADPGVRLRPYTTHDGRHGADIEFDGAAAEPLADVADASDVIGAAIAAAQAASCAEAIGAMEESLRLTAEYLKTRKQFGVPLRTFQTLTQRAADMYVSLELARGMSMYASMSLADGVVDPMVVSRAKLRIGRSAKHIGQEAIQMHGGIGMTDEYPVGHYTARLNAIEHTLGDSTDHLRYLGSHVADYQMVEI